MENGEEEFTDQGFASTEGKNDIRRNRIKELTLKIREDTLRQVLPEEIDLEKNIPIGGDIGDGFLEFQRDMFYNAKVKQIKNKAKEIWGIDLSKY